MSVPVRLAGFAGFLVLIFGATMAIGSASDVKPRRAGQSNTAAGHQAATMSAMAAGGQGTAEPPHGLGVADDKLRLVADTTTYPVGETRPFRFRIVNLRGATVRAFDVEHTKRLHLIAVRRDLTGYQHVHPVQAADGSWSVPLRFSRAGVYRVFADFAAHGQEKTTLATDVFVPGTFQPQTIPAPTTRVAVDGYDVEVKGTPKAGAEGDLEFTVVRDGNPVAVQPYLGADGHLVALREGDLAYLHVHPQETPGSGGPIRFMTAYPSAGRYRLFLQFRHDNQIHTAAFTQEVK